MSAGRKRPCWCSPTAPPSRGRRRDGGTPSEPAPAVGEVVFNTTLTGYQEVLTDPSYAGQIVCFTYPHIGNYGITAADNESRRAFCRGLIARELAPRPSSWRSQRSLGDFLVEQRLPGLEGIDTRRLTRHLRDAGAMPGAFGPVTGPAALPEAAIATAARSAPGTDGVDLAAEVTTAEPYTIGDGPLAGRRLRLRDQTRPSCATSGVWPPSPWSRRRPPPRRCWPNIRTASSSPTARVTPPRSATPPAPSGELLGRGAGLRDLPGPSAAGGRARRPDPQAAVRPPRRQPPGATDVERRGGDHQPEPQLRGRGRHRRRTPRSPTSTSTTGSSKGWPAATCRPSASSTTLKPARAPTTPATSSRSFGSLMAKGA